MPKPIFSVVAAVKASREFAERIYQQAPPRVPGFFGPRELSPGAREIVLLMIQRGYFEGLAAGFDDRHCV